MIMKAFAVYDAKGLCFGVPFFMVQHGLAVRAFMDLTNDPQTTVFKHPGDYSLYQIGTYDDSNALLESISPHVLLGHGSDFKNKLGVVDSAPEILDQLPLLTNGKEK